MDKSYEQKINGLQETIEKLKSERTQYKYLAEHDRLTGLYNQTAAEERVQEILEENRAGSYVLAIFDLDAFKDANDRCGHLFGDQVLEHIASKLRKNRKEDWIEARVGGDEFLLFFEKKPGFLEMLEGLQAELNGDYGGYRVQVSMGAALYPADGGSYRELFQRADEAMYAAKAEGLGKCRLFDGAKML